jgi:CBS domain-containing protein
MQKLNPLPNRLASSTQSPHINGREKPKPEPKGRLYSGTNSMNVKVADIMVSQVMTATPHQTMGHIKKVLSECMAGCLPVVNPEGEPIGIITSTDMLGEYADGSPVSKHMTEHVYTVPQYNDVSVAARIMRNHKIHHVVVTHEKKVVGIVSSYDLLQLVEDHRFVAKNPPSDTKKKNSRKT